MISKKIKMGFFPTNRPTHEIDITDFGLNININYYLEYSISAKALETHT